MENKEKAVAVSGKNDWYGDRFLCCVIRPPGMFSLTDAAEMVHTSLSITAEKSVYRK